MIFPFFTEKIKISKKNPIFDPKNRFFEKFRKNRKIEKKIFFKKIPLTNTETITGNLFHQF